MPSTTDERRARWSYRVKCKSCWGQGVARRAGGKCDICEGEGSFEVCDQSKAVTFLESHGYQLTRKYTWIRPAFFHRPTADEWDAIHYLAEEWDWGGFEPMSPPSQLIHKYDGWYYCPNH